MTQTKLLTRDEAALWQAFQTFSECVLARVARDVLEYTGLSAADYAVLSKLNELGDGRPSQRDLAMALSWDKSRISHHLTRMQERKLLSRSKTAEHGSRVSVTALGREALARARPFHAQAVRRHLTGLLTPQQSIVIGALEVAEPS